MLWKKTYSLAYHSYGYFISQTPDGGFVMSGLCQENVAGSSAPYVIKFDSLGTLQ